MLVYVFTNVVGVFVCLYLPFMVSTLPFADAVYFFPNASDAVNISRSAKVGNVVLNFHDVLKVDKANFISSVLNFSSYYSSTFRVK